MDFFPDATTRATLRMPWDLMSCALEDAVRRAVACECIAPSASSQVSVVVVDVRQWVCWQWEASRYLSERDRRQLARLRRADEQQWRCLGYALLRLWLSGVTGMRPAQLEIARDADGRPLLADGLGDVSLSHAGPWFAFAWSAQGRVGVDLETRERAAGMEGLEDYVCHPHERPGPTARPDHAGLLRLWTRKEAALKRAGLGLSLEPRTFIAPSGSPFRLPGVDDWVQVTEFTLKAPVCLAVAHAPGTASLAHWVRP